MPAKLKMNNNTLFLADARRLLGKLFIPNELGQHKKKGGPSFMYCKKMNPLA